MNIRFEKAVPEDADELIHVRNQCFYEDYLRYGECPGYNVTKEDMIEKILNNISYKIISDNKIVGNISVRDNQDNTYYLGCLCVIPEYANRGIGKAALTFLEKEFANATLWSLETPADKEKNHYFYKKAGYKIVKKCGSSPVELVVFEKKTHPKKRKKVIITLSISIVLLITAFRFNPLTPEGALRNHLLISGHIVSALIMEMKEYKTEDKGYYHLQRTEKIYDITFGVPCEKVTNTNLDRWLIVKTGKGYKCSYYGG